MKSKLFLLLACLLAGLTTISAQAAFVEVTPVLSDGPPGYDLFDLNGAQGLNTVHISGPLPTKILFSNNFKDDVGNQSWQTVGEVVKREFHLDSWELVGLGGGETIHENPFHFLAVHIGKNELLFHFLTAITDFTVTTPGIRNGVGDYRVYNGTFTPPNPVPVPAAVWLFGSAFAGMFGLKRKKS